MADETNFNETAKPQGNLQHRNPDSKLSLKLVTGESALWTLEEAMLPQNFKKLTQFCKEMLTGNKRSIGVMLPELTSNDSTTNKKRK